MHACIVTSMYVCMYCTYVIHSTAYHSIVQCSTVDITAL